MDTFESLLLSLLQWMLHGDFRRTMTRICVVFSISKFHSFCPPPFFPNGIATLLIQNALPILFGWYWWNHMSMHSSQTHSLRWYMPIHICKSISVKTRRQKRTWNTHSLIHEDKYTHHYCLMKRRVAYFTSTLKFRMLETLCGCLYIYKRESTNCHAPIICDEV